MCPVHFVVRPVKKPLQNHQQVLKMKVKIRVGGGAERSRCFSME
jgi:hypothetical protein